MSTHIYIYIYFFMFQWCSHSMLRLEMRALEGQELAGRLSHICAAEDFLSSYRGDMFPSLGRDGGEKHELQEESFYPRKKGSFCEVWGYLDVPSI